MGSMYFILALILVLALYAYSSIKGRDVVKGVEAGSVDKCDSELIRRRSFVASPIKICDEHGNPLSTKGMIRVVVCGNCMKPKGISDNTQLLVEKLDQNSLKSRLKKDDIVMIHLKDKKLDKIRVFDHFDDQEQLITYRFDDSGNRVISSRPHLQSSVVGVVRYKI
jgi:hypothetical protein